MKQKSRDGLRARDGFWHYRFQHQGVEHTGNTGLAATGRNRTEARKIAAEEKRKVIEGEPIEESATFAAAAGEFMAWARDVKYRGKPSTFRRLQGSFTSLVQFFGELPVAELDAVQIELYKMHRIQVHQVRDITLRHDLHALSLFFGDWAIRRGLAELNPLSRPAREAGRGVAIPSDKDAVRIHPLTEEEEALYFERAYKVQDKRGRRNLYDLGKLMILQGGRPEDFLTALKESFRPAIAELDVCSKTHAGRRTLSLCAEAVAICQARMKTPGPWLFPGLNPSRHITQMDHSHNRICRPEPTPGDPKPRVLNFVLYDLRHTFGTRMAVHTDPVTLSHIMGHASLRTIMRYCHPDKEAQRAAMDKYEAGLTRKKLKVVGK